MRPDLISELSKPYIIRDCGIQKQITVKEKASVMYA